jgi:hypothetical protein
MPKCAVIGCFGLAMDENAMIERYPIAVRGLFLVGMFAFGFFEAFVLKSRTMACTTWFLCLASLTAWIAYSWTTASIIAAAVVFAAGLFSLIVFYRSHPES